MLRLPPFRFHRARSLVEAADILAGQGSHARLVAGGTDLWPNMKRRHQKALTVVSLMSMPELRGVRNGDPRAEVGIGATTLLDDVARDQIIRRRYPALARAAAAIASPPIRNMATLGGNLCLDTRCTYYNQTEDWRHSIAYCMKEKGEICWVATGSPRCWAHSASDSAPVLCALDARVRLVSSDTERVLPVAELFQNDGIHYLAKRADEVLAEILLPAEADSTHCRSSFLKLRRRGSIDFAVLSVAAAVRTDKRGTVKTARIYLGAVASYPAPAFEAAGFLLGKALTDETITEAARLARKVATPMDNTDFQAQWRGQMVERYVAAALRELSG
jgi:4-hydroxybenzoyl-CoA reductase subunit beta